MEKAEAPIFLGTCAHLDLHSEFQYSHGYEERPCLTKQNKTKQNKTKQNRTEQNRTEQNRTEQSRAEQSRAEQNRTEQIKTKPVLSLSCFRVFYLSHKSVNKIETKEDILELSKIMHICTYDDC